MKKLPHDEWLRRKRKRDRDYYQANRERLIAYANVYGPKWRKEHPEQTRAITIRWRRKLRSMILQAYGGKCTCCGLADEPFLSIDHISSNGTEHRRKEKLSGAGHHVYAWLKRHDYPNGFQVLCYNCNQAKAHFGRCPHQSRPSSRKR